MSCLTDNERSLIFTLTRQVSGKKVFSYMCIHTLVINVTSFHDSHISVKATKKARNKSKNSCQSISFLSLCDFGDQIPAHGPLSYLLISQLLRIFGASPGSWSNSSFKNTLGLYLTPKDCGKQRTQVSMLPTTPPCPLGCPGMEHH